MWALLQREAQRDPSLLDFERGPRGFSLTRNGNRLLFVFGLGNRIAEGEIRWPRRSDGDTDDPHTFGVHSLDFNPRLFRFDDEDPQDMEAIASRVMREYLEGAGVMKADRKRAGTRKRS